MIKYLESLYEAEMPKNSLLLNSEVWQNGAHVLRTLCLLIILFILRYSKEDHDGSGQ